MLRRQMMEVGVRVEAEDAMRSSRSHTLTAYLTMIALDDGGQPTPVPELEPVDDDERRRWNEAHVRRRIRLSDPNDLLHRMQYP